MSADNGFIIRKSSDGKFALQEYCASADEYPDVDGAAWVFDRLEDAIIYYEELEETSIFPSEYGLTVRIKP